MANTVSTAFIAKFCAEVKLAYQRGELLRGTVRRGQTDGSTYTFQKIGKGVATDKARNGEVVPMNPTHGTATATLVDKYAPEYLDKLDILKLNIDERAAMVTTSTLALHRVIDDQVLTVLNANTSTSAGPIATGLTMAKVANGLFNLQFGTNEVPDDGRMTGVLSWNAYGEMVQLQQFSGQEYVSNRPMMMGAGAKRWLNTTWIPHSGVSKASTYHLGHIYHYDAIGHAIGQEVNSTIDWIPTKVAWLINAYMSMGAVEIDSTGITPMPTAF